MSLVEQKQQASVPHAEKKDKLPEPWPGRLLHKCKQASSFFSCRDLATFKPQVQKFNTILAAYCA